MDISKIDELLNKSNDYLELISQNDLIGFFCNGSIASNNFIGGWSDIDLLVVVAKPELSTIKSLANIENFLVQKTGIKSGISIIGYDSLLSAEKSGDMTKIYKFEEALINNASIFWKEDMYRPIFSSNLFKNINCHCITQMIWDNLIKALKISNLKSDKKYLLRKIFKNTFFLMRLRLLVEEGNVINNIEHIGDLYFKKYKDSSLFEFSNILKKRNIWSTISEETIKKEQISSSWDEFRKLYYLIEKTC